MGGCEFVVIGDDQINAALTGNFRGCDGSDATIDGDNQLRPAIANLCDGFAVQAIPFFDAMRDVVFDLTAKQSDSVPEDRGRGNSIDIVITINDDFLMIANGFSNSFSRNGQI